MKFSITALVAMSTALVSAAPAPVLISRAPSSPESLFKRQNSCAAINDACLQPTYFSLLGSLLAIGGLDVSQITQVENGLTCCPGATCGGGTAALPGFLNPFAALVGGLPYQSCTDD